MNFPPAAKSQDPEVFSRLLVDETFRLIEGEGRLHGGAFTRLVIQRFLTIYISTWASKALQAKAKETATKSEIFSFTAANFAKAKVRIQEAVSEGFQMAMGDFTGKSVEYYCQVNPVPPVANKEPI